MYRILVALIALAVIVFLAGPRDPRPAEVSRPPAGDMARGFRLAELPGGGHLLELADPFGAHRDNWWLIPHDGEVPANASPERVLRTPVTRIVAFGATHLAFLEELGCLESVVGFADFRYLTGSARKLADEGKIVDVGNWVDADPEKLVALKPDVVLIFGDSESDLGITSILDSVSIRGMFVAEYMENHPLGRAEWIKFFGALTGTSKRAHRRYNEIADNYDALRTRVAGQGVARPRVLSGYVFQNVFWAPGGDSYIATLIADAGGDYVWKETAATGGIRREIETVVAEGREIPLWIRQANERTLEDLLAEEPWAEDFVSVRAGNVWANTKQKSGNSNDFWTRGVVEPDKVLLDFTRMIHPREDQLPHWYERLARD